MAANSNRGTLAGDRENLKMTEFFGIELIPNSEMDILSEI